MVGPCHGRQFPYRPLLDRHLLRLTDSIPSSGYRRMEHDYWIYLHWRRLLAGDKVALTLTPLDPLGV